MNPRERLFQAVKRFFRAGPFGGPGPSREMLHVRDLIEGLDAPQTHPSPRTQPACRHLEHAVSLAQGGPWSDLANALWLARDSLSWYFPYLWSDVRTSLRRDLACTDIIGPWGFQPCSELALGFVLLGPGTKYPRHMHPAVELYCLLSGYPAWRAAGRRLGRVSPGTVILHPAQAGHAMRTRDHPMLALYTWRGDISCPSRMA